MLSGSGTSNPVPIGIVTSTFSGITSQAVSKLRHEIKLSFPSIAGRNSAKPEQHRNIKQTLARRNVSKDWDCLNCYSISNKKNLDSYVCSPGVRSQFTKMSTSTINSRGISYDYDSVMHYHSTAFGNGRITITRKDGSTRLGNNRGLSYKDIQQAKLMYCPGQPTRRPVTARPRPPTGNQHASVSFFPGNFFQLEVFPDFAMSSEI